MTNEFRKKGYGEKILKHLLIKAKNLNLRKLSLSIPLNDGYEGGEFETVYGTFNKAKPRLIKQEIGVGIIFPSWVQHQVKPVFSGTRYSIVSWISGPPWR